MLTRQDFQNKKIMWYKKDDRVAMQKGWKWANTILLDSDAFFSSCCPLSTEEWLKAGWKQITAEEAYELLLETGYVE